METNQEQFQSRDLPIDALMLDAGNPRLPEDVLEQDADVLIEYVANAYDAITVAKSIALHGYFPSEPLIALSHDDEYTVVEGNRRLAALKLLHDDDLRDRLNLDDEDEWESLAQVADLPDLIPVILVPDRRSVAPIIGYRHISGIEPWEPWAKARFIALLIEERDLEFDEVANEVGETSNDIRTHYRNYKIIKKARDAFGIPTDRAKNSFGVFTRAMSSLPLREHIGAPAPSEVEVDTDPIPDDRSDDLEELLSWLFGNDDLTQVISESRDITNLGKAVGSVDGLAILRETRDLEEAYIAAGGLRDRLLRRLNRAATSLEAALQEVHEYVGDLEVVSAIDRCNELIEDLRTMVRNANIGDEANHEN